MKPGPKPLALIAGSAGLSAASPASSANGWGCRPSVAMVLGGMAALLLASSRPAHAVPAFAAQTGQACVFCHIGAFGPQLTPAGRSFKIGGYTQTGGEGWRSQIPLSFYWQGSFTGLGKDLPPDQIPHRYASNNNFNIDQASIFLAGGFGEHTGIFSQWTGADNFSAYNLDNTDFRPYTTEFEVNDTSMRVGISLNNNPTVQDPYNSSFAWEYPWNSPSSTLQPQPAADTAVSNGFNQNTIGVNVYAWYDRSLYLDFGLYTSQSHWLLTRLGNSYGVGSIQGVAPYARVAYEWNWNEGSATAQSAHIGAIFMDANVNPLDPDTTQNNPTTTSAFGRNRYTDLAIDGGYQFLGDGTHIGTLLASYTHEWQGLNASANMVNATNAAAGTPTNYGSSYQLDKVLVAVSYWYRNTYGLTLSWEGLWGKKNPVLYEPDPVYGSNNNSPNGSTFIIEADWVPFGKEDSWARPFANLKLGVQYYINTKFNGGNSNYDGYGRSAGNNNTIYVFAWQTF